MRKSPKYILLETLDTLRRINPWRINIAEEIEKIRRLLEERLNLVIAGIAADNASYIYSRKVDEIEKIVKTPLKPLTIREERLVEPTDLPPVQINYPPQKYMIDISDLLDKLEEILEKEVAKKISETDLEISSEEILRYTEEEIRRAEDFILNILIDTGEALFTTLIREALKTGRTHPLYILYAILFMAQEGIITLEPIMAEGDTCDDILIRKEA